MIVIDIVSESKKWQEHLVFIEETCQKLISLTNLNKFLRKNITIELSVLLTLDKKMQKLNKQFRQKDKPTNVLSFPANETIMKNSNYIFLGDVIISYETLVKEAKIQKKSFQNHLTHLILHSILHLIGHDHENEEMANIMENLEIKILKKLKIPNPYLLN
jgi:probable rRNA maturation factor